MPATPSPASGVSEALMRSASATPGASPSECKNSGCKAESRFDGGQSGFAVEGGDASQPVIQHLRVGPHPLLDRLFRVHLIVQDQDHHLILHWDGEDELLQ